MSVYLETSAGDLVVDLFTDECPIACKNFVKLCKYARSPQFSDPVLLLVSAIGVHVLRPSEKGIKTGEQWVSTSRAQSRVKLHMPQPFGTP